MTTLHITHGIIGAGKSTFAKKLEQEQSAIRFNIDECMRHLYGFSPALEKFDEYYSNTRSLILKIIARLLDLGQSVVFDTASSTRKTRDDLRRFAAEHNAEVKFYFIKCEEAEARQRTLKRTREKAEGQLFIDDAYYDVFLSQYEPMSSDEAYELIENY